MNISLEDVEPMVIPGGDITEIDHNKVWEYLANVQSNQGMIAGIVGFAIEVAKKMDLFEDEADLRETIAFGREHQRV